MYLIENNKSTAVFEFKFKISNQKEKKEKKILKKGKELCMGQPPLLLAHVVTPHVQPMEGKTGSSDSHLLPFGRIE